MLTLTLDTSCVIHAAQRQEQAELVDQLVEAARAEQVGLWLTTVFYRDQERASATNSAANLAWLEQAPVLGAVPGPFRLDYSVLGGPDVLGGGVYDTALRRIILPQRLWAESMTEGSALSPADVRKFHDVQHLCAHHMAQHDAFVTSDEDDLLDKAERIKEETGIVVWSLAQAVEQVRQQA
jgi:hypothetical protein